MCLHCLGCCYPGFISIWQQNCAVPGRGSFLKRHWWLRVPAEPWLWYVGCASPMAQSEPGDVEHLPDAGGITAFNLTVPPCTK
ncbi:hypothetical protein EK904_000335 [Melospiza melodia maxima]|nr:hypothetical protein EK904_000335 [Melospiza melodia maxima]